MGIYFPRLTEILSFRRDKRRSVYFQTQNPLLTSLGKLWCAKTRIYFFEYISNGCRSMDPGIQSVPLYSRLSASLKSHHRDQSWLEIGFEEKKYIFK